MTTYHPTDYENELLDCIDLLQHLHARLLHLRGRLSPAERQRFVYDLADIRHVAEDTFDALEGVRSADDSF